MYFKIA